MPNNRIDNANDLTLMDTLQDGINRFHTPMYLFHSDILADTIQNLRENLRHKARICFAIKANPFLVSEAAQLTDRIEVCSMGEYRICRSLNIPPEKMLISGVLKRECDLFEILNTCGGACMYTAESPAQFQLLQEWSSRNQTLLRVFPRLTSPSQFGMDLEELLTILRSRADYPYIRIEGIHFFTGTQKKGVKKIRKELEYLDQLLPELEQAYGEPFRELEYGPGLSVPYFTDQQDQRTDDCTELANLLDTIRWQGSITLEMGRFIAAQCGFYCTQVMDCKTNNGKNYCIVDGGLHHLNYDGQIRGMYLPHLLHLKGVTPAASVKTAPVQTASETDSRSLPAPDRMACEYPEHEDWTVCGALCTTNDILLQKAAFSGLQVGDIIVFERTGAYAMTEGMSLFLSHPLPAVARYSSREGWTLLRSAVETYPLNMVMTPGGKDTDGAQSLLTNDETT